jgi:hypothetical protein
MVNRTNQMVELENGKEYGIIKHILYQGRTFFVASEYDKEKEDFKEEIVILEQVVYEGKDSIKKLKDPEIIQTIIDNLTTNEE